MATTAMARGDDAFECSSTIENRQRSHIGTNDDDEDSGASLLRGLGGEGLLRSILSSEANPTSFVLPQPL
jgi:hypothetical protein